MASVLDRPLSRRRFLEASAVGGAALLLSGPASSALAGGSPTDAITRARRRDEDEDWFEATVPKLQRLMREHELSSVGLTKAYLRRIRDLDPVLGAVIETNPDALRIATQRDRERRHGHVRGPLHGIPVLVKDNIATDDRMETTAGSFALVGSQVPRDAAIITRLRQAGAVILGKANLSEWANFRGFIPAGFPNGWSGRGSFTRNPYVLDWDPCGSSSGSAVAAAANLAALTVGTETDGSIICPAGNNNVVGLKPTLGLVAQRGIIPIAHSQDTAGPITRTVTDAAILLNTLRSPFGPVKGHKLPKDYRRFLKRGALKGARIGVDRLEFQEDHFAVPELNLVTEQALDVMHDAGATIIDIAPADCPDPNSWFESEFLVLLTEFKHDVAAYMKPLRHTKMRTLADLIEFNIEHCKQEMTYFGQELFDMAEATTGDLTDPAYLAARAESVKAAGPDGLDRVLKKYDLDVLVSPAYSSGYSAAAVAGYASITVPAGVAADGRPGTVTMSGRFLDEPRLLALAYDLEKALGKRDIPKFLGSVPGPFADAGICAALGTTAAAGDRAGAAAADRAGAGALARTARPRL
jgi:amidase